MPSPKPQIAVAFVAREKFSWALASLRRLYRLAGAPFTLYFVEGFYPPAVQAELDAFLAGKDHVVRVRADRFLYPGEALNLVIAQCAEPHVLQIQNDVMITRNLLAGMLETLERLACDLVVPVVLDVELGRLAMHHDAHIAWNIFEQDGRVFVDQTWEAEELRGHRRMLQFETHCFLMTRAAARAVCPLPPLNSREHIDLAMRLRAAGMRAYLDGRALTVFMPSPPLPLRDIECDFYRHRWGQVRARQSHDYVAQKWRIADLPSAMAFVEVQQKALLPGAVLHDYASVSERDPWPDDLALARGNTGSVGHSGASGDDE